MEEYTYTDSREHGDYYSRIWIFKQEAVCIISVSFKVLSKNEARHHEDVWHYKTEGGLSIKSLYRLDSKAQGVRVDGARS